MNRPFKYKSTFKMLKIQEMGVPHRHKTWTSLDFFFKVLNMLISEHYSNKLSNKPSIKTLDYTYNSTRTNITRKANYKSNFNLP